MNQEVNRLIDNFWINVQQPGKAGFVLRQKLLDRVQNHLRTIGLPARSARGIQFLSQPINPL
jgi:hypothetical protein